MKPEIFIRDYDTCPRCGSMVHVWEGEGRKLYIVCDECFLKTVESYSFEKVDEDWEKLRKKHLFSPSSVN